MQRFHSAESVLRDLKRLMIAEENSELRRRKRRGRSFFKSWLQVFFRPYSLSLSLLLFRNTVYRMNNLVVLVRKISKCWCASSILRGDWKDLRCGVPMLFAPCAGHPFGYVVKYFDILWTLRTMVVSLWVGAELSNLLAVAICWNFWILHGFLELTNKVGSPVFNSNIRCVQKRLRYLNVLIP